MRIFEFRVWDGKKFHYFPYSGHIKSWINSYDPLIEIDGVETFFSWRDIQQFTCLHDKNNKKIFEGDIIKFCYFESWMNNNCEEIFQIVFYNENLGAFRMGSQYVVDNHILEAMGMELTSDCEVVGNIFENKDLIK